MINFEQTDDRIVIVGLPASGKSTFLQGIKSKLPYHSVYVTDDYIKFGQEEGFHRMLLDMKKDPNPRKVIEGVTGFKLLKKGMEDGSFFPNLVINIKCNEVERLVRYSKRGKDPEQIKGFDKSLTKMYDDYQSRVTTIDPKFRPREIQIDTTTK